MPECASVTLRVLLQNNVTQQVASEFPKFHALNITSGAGGISVNGLSASHNGRIVSDSGRVRVQTLSAVDMHVETTDSDLIAINVTSVNYVPLVRTRGRCGRVVPHP